MVVKTNSINIRLTKKDLENILYGLVLLVDKTMDATVAQSAKIAFEKIQQKHKELEKLNS